MEFTDAKTPVSKRMFFIADHGFCDETYQAVSQEYNDRFQNKVGFYVGQSR